ncbi:MAG: hypothetical protein JXA77_13560 [Bacteroidales bacterium]|nr:hypothetical protein [Bacteroidales bacterium]
MIHLLKMVKEEGITIQEAVSRQVLPKIAILDSEGKFWDVRLNKRITPEEWYYENPLGKYGKLVVLKGAENERKSFNK